MSDHLVLVGMMATGKTTVGRAVADRLGRPFFDSDELAEAATGRTVREIFATDGEAGYRPLETAALIGALDQPEPAVIAAAGGVVLAEENRTALRRPNVTVVWLRASVPVLLRRIEAEGGPGHRPLLDDDPEAALRRLSDEREPLYREVADVIVDVDDLTPEQVVDRVVAVATAEGQPNDGR